jgi:hypothetical protein
LSYFKNEVAINYEFKGNVYLNNLEIKHVIFRNNKKPPGNYVRLASTGDKKTLILPEFKDLRVLFLLYEFTGDVLTNFKYRFQVFEKKNMDDQLNELVINFLTSMVFSAENGIFFPPFMEPYSSDFGSESNSSDMIKFLLKIYQINKDKELIYQTKFSNENLQGFDNSMGLIRKVMNGSVKIYYNEDNL